jgi:hypothetical protein
MAGPTHKRSLTLWAILTAVVSLLIALVALILADFGAPWWVFAFLLLWMLTVGLPTTLALVLAATCWGRAPGLWGPVPCLVCALILSAVFQWAALWTLDRLRKQPRQQAP